jgi:beta-mannosidase
MEFVDSKGVIYRNHRLLTSVKEARLPLPSLRWSVKECSGGFEVSVSSDVFAKGVFLNVSGGMLEADSAGKALAGTCTARNFSDNYFDLLPGESRTVRLESPLNEAQFRRALSVRCVVKN